MKKVCVAAVLMVLAFTASAALSAPTVKIGFDDARSGPFKNNGDYAATGMNVAVQELNRTGGLLGRQIEIVEEDNQNSPELAVQKLKKLILEDNVEAVFHQTSSTCGLAIQQAIPRYKKIFVEIGATAMDFTTVAFNPYSFRTSPSTVMYVKGHMIYFLKEKKYKKIYLINFDSVYGHDVAKYSEKFLKENAPDVQIVGNEFHPVFTKDFAPYITKIKASGADYIFTGDWGTDLIQLLKQGNSLGLHLPMAGILLGDASLAPVVGDAMIGAVISDFMIAGVPTAKAKAFEDAFYKEAKVWPVEQIYEGWIGVTLWAEAVKKAGSFDTDKVAKAWEGMEFDGPYGKILMRAKDHQALMPFCIGKVEGKTKYYDFPYFTYVMGIPREQIDFKPEDYGWKPYTGR